LRNKSSKIADDSKKMLETKQIPILSKLLFALLALFLQVNLNAQSESVIDNKGNIITVRNNSVTANTVAPTSPVEGDVWFDTTVATNPSIFIWDGAVWQEITHKAIEGSVFFAGTDGTPDEDNAQLFWDDTNNRLGIGTNSPGNKLEVTGAIRSEGILNSNGTVTEPSYRFNSDSNTGMFRPAADEIGLTVGGIEAIHIDETSNNTTVTITETLELDGQIMDENDSVGTAGQYLTATATGTEWVSSVGPVKAIGKISSTGGIVKATTGITITKLAGNGRYRVNLPLGMVSDDHYIIQLSQPGRAGAGNDDPGISYSAQDSTGFDVIIGDNDNGGTDRARYNSEFMFTVLDL